MFDFKTENPMVRDELWRPYVVANDEEDIEDFVRFHIYVDTRKLTQAEETKLLTKLENIYIVGDYDDSIGFDVEAEQLPEFEDTDFYGHAEVYGIVPEYTYDQICDLLDKYNVDWKG